MKIRKDGNFDQRSNPGPRGPQKNGKNNFRPGFERIPITSQMTMEPEAALRQIGIKIICVDPDDDLFYRCKIPRGWTKSGTDIVDKDKKVRVKIKIHQNEGVRRSQIVFPYFTIIN